MEVVRETQGREKTKTKWSMEQSRMGEEGNDDSWWKEKKTGLSNKIKGLVGEETRKSSRIKRSETGFNR